MYTPKVGTTYRLDFPLMCNGSKSPRTVCDALLLESSERERQRVAWSAATGISEALASRIECDLKIPHQALRQDRRQARRQHLCQALHQHLRQARRQHLRQALRDMILNMPLLADLELIRQRRQALIDEQLIRSNRRRISHDYQSNDEVQILSYKLGTLDPRALPLASFVSMTTRMETHLHV
jgi:hypothetical protein